MFAKKLVLLWTFWNVTVSKAWFMSNVTSVSSSFETILPPSLPVAASTSSHLVAASLMPTTFITNAKSSMVTMVPSQCASTVTETRTVTVTQNVIQTKFCSKEVSVTIAPTSSSVDLPPTSSVFITPVTTTTTTTTTTPILSCDVCLLIVVDAPCNGNARECNRCKKRNKNKKGKGKKKKDCNKGFKTGKKGLNIITTNEKCRLKAYKCPAGVWTIGYGHTAGVRKGDVINKAKAKTFLKEDVKCAENAIKREVKVCLNQNQFDALVSLVFNIGVGAFKESTLLKKLNQGKFDVVPCEMKRWVFSKGKKLGGLVKRRNAEAKLFKSKR